MEARLAVHDKLSSWFVERTDLELSDLLARAAPRPGWGMTRTVEVAGHQVFDLTDQERVFLESHRCFDIAEFISSLDWQAPDQPEHDEAYKQALEPYRALIDEMSEVFSRLAAGPKTSGEYNDSRIASLLAEASSP